MNDGQRGNRSKAEIDGRRQKDSGVRQKTNDRDRQRGRMSERSVGPPQG